MTLWSKVLAAGLVLYSIVVVGLLVFVVIGESGGRLVSEDIYFIPVIVGTIVGAFLSFKRPDNRMGLLMTVMAAALLTLDVSNVMVPWSLQQGNDVLVVIGTHLSDLVWITQFVTALVLLPLWFPTGGPSTEGGPGWVTSPSSPSGCRRSPSSCRKRSAHTRRQPQRSVSPSGIREVSMASPAGSL